MANAATQASLFTHPPYAITINSWSSKTKTQGGQWLLRNGDQVTCTQHGPQTIVGTASIAYDLEKAPGDVSPSATSRFAKVGDVTTCGALINSGDPNLQWS